LIEAYPCKIALNRLSTQKSDTAIFHAANKEQFRKGSSPLPKRILSFFLPL
jgi:hypothetical protein